VGCCCWGRLKDSCRCTPAVGRTATSGLAGASGRGRPAFADGLCAIAGAVVAVPSHAGDAMKSLAVAARRLGLDRQQRVVVAHPDGPVRTSRTGVVVVRVAVRSLGYLAAQIPGIFAQSAVLVAITHSSRVLLRYWSRGCTEIPSQRCKASFKQSSGSLHPSRARIRILIKMKRPFVRKITLLKSDSDDQGVGRFQLEATKRNWRWAKVRKSAVASVEQVLSAAQRGENREDLSSSCAL